MMPQSNSNRPYTHTATLPNTTQQACDLQIWDSADDFLQRGLPSLKGKRYVMLILQLAHQHGEQQSSLPLPPNRIPGNSWETLQALAHRGHIPFPTSQKPLPASPRLQELRRHLTQEGQRVKQRLKSQRIEDLLETLSRREWEVLMGLLRGQSCKQIGAALHIGLPTITKHRGHLLEKLHVASVTDLITLLWSNVATELAHAN